MTYLLPDPNYNFQDSRLEINGVFAQVWKEAAEAGCAPPVLLGATNEKALDVVSLADLEYHALAGE